MTAAGPDGARFSGLSIRGLIDARAKATPDSLFLIDPDSGVSIAYGELRLRARAVANRIAEQGIAPGESVAYAMANGVPSALCILGILYGGYLATAINLAAGKETLAFVLEHSEARLVLTQDRTASVISEAMAGRVWAFKVVEVTAVYMTPRPCDADLTPPGRAQDGLLMYTSGTTGRAKGVVLTHANLLAGGENTVLAHGLTARDRVLCVLPLYHINGLCVTILGPLVSGGSVAIPARFSVSTFWDTLETKDCTWFSVVPTQISYLLHGGEGGECQQRDLKNIRFGRSASAPLSPDVQQAFESRFGIPIVETMGLTETAAQILSNPLPPGTRKIGSPGVAIGNEVIIADLQRHEVPRGQEGELLIRGPNVMRMYLKDEAATREALTPDGWLCTGDLGRMDEDGYVYIAGRLKELIIKGGENIAPRELDEALYSHPDVIEAAAFARDCPDYGQRVEACVVVADSSKASEAELIDLCRAKIGAFKTPDRIYFLSDLPKGPSGKIQRNKLPEIVARISSR